MTIASQLLQVANSKSAIAAAIEAKGVTVGAALFADYAGKIAEITSGGAEPTASGWVRPADWLPLPTVVATEQKFVGLYAVDDDDSNFVAILAQGAYTVDWGDGVVENFASNAKAQHQYTYANLPIESLSSRGYKQVVVTLTPQAGQNITLLNMNQRPTGFGNQQRTLQWLDVTISTPNVSSLTVSGAATNASLDALEQCTILTLGSVTTMHSAFKGCANLQSLPLFDTSAVTTMHSAFYGCTNLRSVPFFNTNLVTSLESAFRACATLRSVPLFDTLRVISLYSAFEGCTNLQYVPLFNTSAVSSMFYTFYGCTTLQSVPLFDASAVTGMSNMFGSCTSLGRSQLLGVKITHSYSACNLSAAALNEVFTNLATVTGQTITITNNPGAATCNRSIATAKGWTVTG